MSASLLFHKIKKYKFHFENWVQLQLLSGLTEALELFLCITKTIISIIFPFNAKPLI